MDFATCEKFFTDIMPGRGYPLRKSQLELSQKIDEVIQTKKILVAEAEVGTGKTFAYLFPAILEQIQTGGKILISTNTIELQEQQVFF